MRSLIYSGSILTALISTQLAYADSGDDVRICLAKESTVYIFRAGTLNPDHEVYVKQGTNGLIEKIGISTGELTHYRSSAYYDFELVSHTNINQARLKKEGTISAGEFISGDNSQAHSVADMKKSGDGKLYQAGESALKYRPTISAAEAIVRITKANDMLIGIDTRNLNSLKSLNLDLSAGKSAVEAPVQNSEIQKLKDENERIRQDLMRLQARVTELLAKVSEIKKDAANQKGDQSEKSSSLKLSPALTGEVANFLVDPDNPILSYLP